MELVDLLPSYWDTCPDVCTPKSVLVEKPTAVKAMDSGWYIANYCCAQCGCEWACSWGAGGYGEAADRFMHDLAEATMRSGVVMLMPGERRYPQQHAKSA